MAKWVRFSRDVLIQGKKYSSRVWYSVPNEDAEYLGREYHGAIRVEKSRPEEEVLAGILDLQSEEIIEIEEPAVEEPAVEEPAVEEPEKGKKNK